ncbi:MAG: hypothetical protein JSV68_06565 [Anaerolineaceae bacterium]|nr:MAG: hypothetical protein JSV68_06565 [Anaerolineaceae bacterium]
MLRKTVLIAIVIVLSLAIALPVLAGGGPPPTDEDGNRVRVVVYVTSQGLYYDSIVGPALPQRGPFQQLFPPGTNPDWPELDTLSTEFGPGTPGHKGGRWWVDVNGNGEMDEGDVFFSCPLLGPGRAEP